MQRTYLSLNPKAVTESYLEQYLLPRLPQWRREQALSFRFHAGRVLSAQAFLLLKDGLASDFGITDELEFDYLHSGKPVLRHHPDVHFSLSHCSEGVLCVVDDGGEVGCDIETCRRHFSDALLKRCFNASEVADIRSAADTSAVFARLWTQKEAVAKFTGDGLALETLPDLLLSFREQFPDARIETCHLADNHLCYSVVSVSSF